MTLEIMQTEHYIAVQAKDDEGMFMWHVVFLDDAAIMPDSKQFEEAHQRAEDYINSFSK